MFVNTNVAALNSWRNLENTQTDMTNVLQQMSSGYRINTAADDPAGLAISQQMQSQIGGLNQAYLNAQSGISLLQTADGGLGQIQNILQSMRSLASEAATSTMNSNDTANLQTEMNQYSQEITQITNTTQFNDINVLDGGFTGQTIQVGANQGQTLNLNFSAADAYSLGVTGLSATDSTNTVAQSAISVGGVAPGSYSLSETTTPWTLAAAPTDVAGTITSVAGTYTGQQADSVGLSGWANLSGSNYIQTGSTVQVTTNSGTTTATVNASNQITVDGLTVTFAAAAAANGSSASFTIDPTSTAVALKQGASTILSTTETGAISQSQQVSLNNGSQSLVFNQATAVNNSSTSYASPTWTAAAGAAVTDTITVAQSGSAAVTNGVTVTTGAVANTGLYVGSQGAAASALTTIDNAINTLSTQRANVGAYQNRLQFASSDVQTTSQNLTAARAGIMDADMAMGMANLSKDQVLEQSGVAMLAQANQVPQALLKLLP